MAMSPEEAQRASIKAALDRVGSLNPADPPEGLRAPRAGPVSAAAPGTALAVDNRPNFTMGGQPQQPGVTDARFRTTGGNPNVPSGGSPQAQAWQAERMANQGPPRPSGAAPQASWADRMNSTSQRIDAAGAKQAEQIKALGGKAMGPLRTAKDTLRAAGNVVGSAMSTPLGQAAGRVFSGVGGVLAAGDLNEAVGQGNGAGALDAGFRLGTGVLGAAGTTSMGLVGTAGGAGYLAGTGIRKGMEQFESGRRGLDWIGEKANRLAQQFGGGVDDSAKKQLEAMERGGAAAPTRAAPQPIAGSAQEPPPSLRAPQVTQSQVRAAEPQEPATPSNVVTVRNGNQFSGEGVKEGFSYDGAPRAGLTSMPADNFASVSPALDRQRAEAMAQLTPAQAAAALGDPGYSRGATPGMGGFGGATLSSAANERFNYAGLPEREKDRQAALRTAQMQADARRYEADAQEQSGLRADATTRRGQDLDLLGREATARTSLRSTERANEKDAFDRTLKIAEFDTKRADAALAQQQSAEKSWQSAVENRFRDPADPTKPDTRKVAAFNTAVDATIPSLADQLEKSGQGAVAADLRKRGRAALGPAELNELQQLFELRELSLQTDGWALGSSSAVMADDLLGYRPRAAGGVQKNLIGSDTVVTANGTKIRRDKLVYGPDGNAILPDFGVPRTDFRRYYDQPTNR